MLRHQKIQSTGAWFSNEVVVIGTDDMVPKNGLSIGHQGALLITWINLNPSMDK